MPLEAYATTDVGLRRSHNEDHFAVWIPEDQATLAARGALFALADGMGGASAGEVASRLAVETAVSTWASARVPDPLESLVDAAEAANHAVHQQSHQPGLHGMGTTLTLLVVRGSAAWVAHVGDSRAYLLRDGAIRQLTQDHSLVAQLVRDRQLTPEQARVDPRRNVVTRSVGVAPVVEVDALHVDEPLRPGDVLLLASDGLHGVVTDAEIATAASMPDLHAACETLVALAKDRGGPDNITVVVVRILPGSDAAAGPRA